MARRRAERGDDPERELELALARAKQHAKSAVSEALEAVRALLDAVSLATSGAPAHTHPLLELADRWLVRASEGLAAERVVTDELAAPFDTDIASELAVAPSGDRLVTGHGPGAMHELPGGRRLGVLEGSPSRVQGLAFDGAGTTLAAATDRSVTIYDPASGRRRLLLESPGGRLIGRVVISSDGRGPSSRPSRPAMSAPSAGKKTMAE